MKKTWKGRRLIISIKNSTAPKIAQLNVTGRIVNDFFVNIGPNTEKEIPKVFSISYTLAKECHIFRFK